MGKTIWVVTEIILNEYGAPSMRGNVNCYSTRERAIDEVYMYLANDFEDDDLEDNVVKTLDDPEDDPSGNLTITTYCGDKYGKFDCRYHIEERILDGEFGT